MSITAPQNRRTTTPGVAQRRAAAHSKAGIMRERSDWTARLLDGSATLADLLNRKPACFRRMLIPDVLLLAPGVAHGTLASLNAKAVFDGINLLLPLGDAPERTIEWLTCHIDGREWRREKHPCGCEKAQVADQLDEAIREHRAMCSDPDLPATMFGNADDVLYRAHQRALDLKRPISNDEGEREPVVDSAPFRVWVGQQMQLLSSTENPEEGVSAPAVALAQLLDVSPRQLNRYQTEATLRLSTVDRALTSFGAPALLNELYPLAEAA